MDSVSTPESTGTNAICSRPIPIPGQPEGKGVIAIRPARIPSDVPALGLLGRICFTYSSRLLFPHADPNDPSTQEDETRWRGGRFVKRVRNGNPAFVAVASNSSLSTESTGAGDGKDEEWSVVGVAQWKAPKKSEAGWKSAIESGLHGDWRIVSGEEAGGEYQAGLSKEEEAGKFPETMDIKKYDELMEVIQRDEKKILDSQGVDEGDVWCESLFPHPPLIAFGLLRYSFGIALTFTFGYFRSHFEKAPWQILQVN